MASSKARASSDDPQDAPEGRRVRAGSTWPERRRARAQEIRRRANKKGMGYWIVWGIPFVGLLAMAWTVERVKAAGKRTRRFFVKDVREAPAKVRAGVEASGQELSSRKGRRALLRALFDERGLTQRRRIALLTLTCIVLGLAWAIMEVATLVFWSELLAFKHETDLLLFYGIGTRLFLPTPFEVLLLRSAEVIGAPTAIVIASIGATVGSWILFIVGAQANKGLTTWMQKRAWTRRTWAWLEENAQRFGYLLMGLILAIPFSPDAVTAVFTVLGLQMRLFLLTIFLATIVRLSLFLWLFT